MRQISETQNDGEDSMSIEKKSLISSRTAAKKAVIARGVAAKPKKGTAMEAKAAPLGHRAATMGTKAAALGHRAATMGTKAAALGTKAATLGIKAATLGTKAAAVSIRAATLKF